MEYGRFLPLGCPGSPGEQRIRWIQSPPGFRPAAQNYLQTRQRILFCNRVSGKIQRCFLTYSTCVANIALYKHICTNRLIYHEWKKISSPCPQIFGQVLIRFLARLLTRFLTRCLDRFLVLFPRKFLYITRTNLISYIAICSLHFPYTFLLKGGFVFLPSTVAGEMILYMALQTTQFNQSRWFESVQPIRAFLDEPYTLLL